MEYKGKYVVKTYGCQMNVHESEKLAGMLKSLGYQETENDNEASVIVFNTCAIRDGAEQKVFGHIGALKQLKKDNPNLIIAVCGCMAQIKGRVDVFKKKYPFVSIVFGTHNINEFKNYLLKYENYKQNIYEIWDTEKEISENVEMYRTSNYNAWVNIMYGCNNFCTFCIVPYVRGRERSRKMEDIIEEVKELVAQGFKYVTLLGQNVNSYGNDIEDKSVSFAKLLENLAQIEGDFRVKFLTSHPKDLNSDVIDVVAKYPKISRYIHLPVQSGSNRVLKLMNRKYTIEHYLGLINEIRTKVPDAFISTDIIVGFPKETEEDFMQTYELVKNVGYDGVFAFMYSPRTGTVAEKMEEQVPQEVKKERVNKLLALSKSISKAKTNDMLGKTYECVIENVIEYEGNKCLLAATDSGKPIIVTKFDTVNKPMRSSLCKVNVTNIVKGKVIGQIL